LRQIYYTKQPVDKLVNVNGLSFKDTTGEKITLTGLVTVKKVK